ncbi:hypothetical protein C0989_005841 [Termitomyces sp. Mn162]|nr:hypothetical protein C0989_005841 [Termitomyces sp. Mn162]
MQHSKPASNLFPSIQAASSSSSFSSVLAPTLAPIAEAEEPSKDVATQPKEHNSKMDKAATVALSAIPDNSTLISNLATSATDSGVPSGSIRIDNSALISNTSASATNSVIATRLTAGNKSTVLTGITVNEPAIPAESTLATLIAATGQLMDVDTTAPTDEIAL